MAALSYTRKHVVYGEITTHTAWMEIGIVSDMQVYIPELHAPPVGGSLRPGSPARPPEGAQTGLAQTTN